MKVLIVDDSTFTRKLVMNALSGRDYEFIQADTGGEAVRLYQEHRPNLVLMDIIMPQKDGLEALKEIKQFDPNAYVVVVTAYGSQKQFIEDILKAGAADIIKKPFKDEELVRTAQIAEHFASTG